jgi:hypothetical protein
MPLVMMFGIFPALLGGSPQDPFPIKSRAKCELVVENAKVWTDVGQCVIYNIPVQYRLRVAGIGQRVLASHCVQVRPAEIVFGKCGIRVVGYDGSLVFKISPLALSIRFDALRVRNNTIISNGGGGGNGNSGVIGSRDAVVCETLAAYPCPWLEVAVTCGDGRWIRLWWFLAVAAL